LTLQLVDGGKDRDAVINALTIVADTSMLNEPLASLSAMESEGQSDFSASSLTDLAFEPSASSEPADSYDSDDELVELLARDHSCRKHGHKMKNIDWFAQDDWFSDELFDFD